MLFALIIAASPLPRTSSLCPIGYYPISGYCAPHARTTRRALPRTTSICPPNTTPQLTYCLERPTQ